LEKWPGHPENYGIGLLLPPGNIALFSIPKIKIDNYER
jgi:hypothetical protein